MQNAESDRHSSLVVAFYVIIICNIQIILIFQSNVQFCHNLNIIFDNTKCLIEDFKTSNNPLLSQ